MARFAFAPEPEVSPTGAPGNDYQRISASPASFGAIGAQARERLGAGVVAAADAGLSALTDWQTKQNHLHAAELKSYFDEGLTKLHTEYMQLEGRAALDARPAYEQKVKELRQQAIEKAPSLQERTLLAPGLTSLSDQYARYWAGHAASQMRVYEKKVASDRIANNGALAVNALIAGDEDSFARHLEHQGLEVHNLYDGRGYDQETIGLEAGKQRGATVKTAVETIAAGGDIARAQAVFERYQDRIDPQSRLAITQYLKSGKAQLEGRAIADREMGHDGAAPTVDKQKAYERVLAVTDANPLVQNAAITRLNQVYSIYHSEAVNRHAAFDIRLKDETAEGLSTGALKTAHPLTQADFVDRYGATKGPAAWQEHVKNIALGADIAAVATMSPQEQEAVLARHAPQPGAEGYAGQAQRYDAVVKAVNDANTQKHNDPGGFAVARLPVVQAAYQGLGKALADPNATPALRHAAAAQFATITQAEQQRVGVPANAVALLPKPQIEGLATAIAKIADSDDPQARIGLIARIQQEAELWGEHWPAVMRQLAPTAQPIVRAIAAGADPAAMTRLLSLGKDEAPAKLLKEQNETKFKDLTTALNTEMAPFLRTLVGRQKDRDFTGYYGLAEKLSALYVRDGSGADTAAAKAFKELIGGRYEFRDTWRIPRSAGVAVDDVHKGVLEASDRLRGGGVQIESSLPAADAAMKLTPQERELYRRHSSNLTGAGGVDNADGSRSTLFATTVGFGDRSYIIPTVWDGKVLSADQAVARARDQGLDKFPSYANDAEAQARYRQLHDFMEQDTARYLQARRSNPLADIRPAVNDIGIADPRADSLAKFGRDGTFVTAADNSGLNLVYGDKFVRRTDGSPLLLTWAQLVALGRGRVLPASELAHGTN